MDLGISGKVALVTAASRGLGRACAEKLAAEQCRVAICARNGEQARQAAGEIAAHTGADVAGFEADVSRGDAIIELLTAVERALAPPPLSGLPMPAARHRVPMPPPQLRPMMMPLSSI